MNTNLAAACTVTSLAGLTIGATCAAVSAATTVATTVYAIFATFSLSLSLASISAWATLKDRATPTEYFEQTAEHLKIAIPAIFQFISAHIFSAAMDGACRVISNRIEKKFS